MKSTSLVFAVIAWATLTNGSSYGLSSTAQSGWPTSVVGANQTGDRSLNAPKAAALGDQKGQRGQQPAERKQTIRDTAPQPGPGPQESFRNNSPYPSIGGPEQVSIRSCDGTSSGRSGPVSRQQRRQHRSNFCSQSNGRQAAVEHDQAPLAFARPGPSSKHQSADHRRIHECKPRKQRNN